MADYEGPFDVLIAVSELNNVPADLEDTVAMDAWVAALEAACIAELTNQSYTPSAATLSLAYALAPDELTYSWVDQGPLKSVAPITASEWPVPGRAH